MENDEELEDTAPTVRRYVVFERSTGRVLTTATHVSGPGDRGELSREELLQGVPASVEDVDVLEVGAYTGGGDVRVDVERRALVPLLQLRVEPERTELQGGDEEWTDVVVTVVDEEGDQVGDFDGELVVTTTRGRLSERGGRVRAEGGRAVIGLLSIPETVSAVRITAIDPSGRSVPGSAVVEFV